MDSSTVNLPSGYTIEQPQAAQTPASLPPGYTLESSQPQLDLSNKAGEGTYQMNGSNGQSTAVPYSQVHQATTQGYTFADNDSFSRFRKDVSADPNNQGSDWDWFSSSDPTPEQQTVNEKENNSTLGQASSGVVQGGKDLLNMANPVNIAKGIWHQLPPVALADSVKQTLPLIDTYEKARSSGASVTDALAAANQQAQQQDAVTQSLKQAVAEFQKNPTQETARLVTDAAGLIGTAWATSGAGLDTEAAGVGADAAEAADATSATKAPSLFKQVTQGADVAQPMTQDAVRSAAQVSAKNAGTATEDMLSDIDSKPIQTNGDTILDDHLAAVRQKAKDAYQKVDSVVGFDLKAEKVQLKNDLYKLGNLGNTDTDITQRGNLIEAINDSEDRISDAEQKLKAAGIDPTAADTIHQQFRAGQDFKKALVQSSTPDGAVNVDSLLRKSNALRFNKYGDRLSQFLGNDDAANDFISQLQQAQKAGVHAVKVQNITKTLAKWLGGGIVSGGAAGLGYEILKK